MFSSTYLRVIILLFATVDIMCVSCKNRSEMRVYREYEVHKQQQLKRPAGAHTTRVSTRACELTCAVWHNHSPLKHRLPWQSVLANESSLKRTPNEYKYPTNLTRILANNAVVHIRKAHTNAKLGGQSNEGRQRPCVVGL